MKKKKAVVLLSGGMDSATVLAIAVAEGYKVHALTVNYGQRHSIEVKKARQIARRFRVKSHLIFPLDLTRIGGSSLTGDLPVPKRAKKPSSKKIPPTYVPARNTILLSLALALAERVHARYIFVGANAVDYSGYPDCRPAYLKAFASLARLGTKAGVEDGVRFAIHAPLLRLTKEEIIRKGLSLGVDFGMTHSCYDPDRSGRACGKCDSCLLRLKGFREAGVRDPISYASPVS